MSEGSEITGELNAAELTSNGPRQGVGHRRFPYSGCIFNQKVTAGKQCYQALAYSLAFALNDRLDGGRQ